MATPQAAELDAEDESESEAESEQSETPSEDVDEVEPDDLGEQASLTEETPSPEETSQPDDEGEQPDVDPSDIDTVDLDPFEEGVDQQLDELSDATAREEEKRKDDGIDVADSSLGEESPFSGDEDFGGASGGHQGQQGQQSQFGDALGDDEPDDNFDEIIIEGFARLAVINIEPKTEQSQLQDEFEEVFEAFRLGHFGREVIYEYIIIDDQQDIDPIWGFFGSMLMCSVVVMWMRPDSDEIVGNGKETIEEFIDGVKS